MSQNFLTVNHKRFLLHSSAFIKVLKFHSLLSNTLFKQHAVHPTTLQLTAPWLVGNYSDRSVKHGLQTSADGSEISDADGNYIFLDMTECAVVCMYTYRHKR